MAVKNGYTFGSEMIVFPITSACDNEFAKVNVCSNIIVTEKVERKKVFLVLTEIITEI